MGGGEWWGEEPELIRSFVDQFSELQIHQEIKKHNDINGVIITGIS
jgi:hypothetical protein